MTRMTAVSAILAASTALVNSAAAKTELTMYYPIAVGGALTEVVDGIVARFEEQNPDVTVNAIYAGNYDDTRIKALAALDSGEPAQLAVMFSIDAYDLIEQDLIVPFESVIETEEERAWLDSFYPALMANGRIEGQTWGVPFQRSTIVAYYNKDMFREAGLDPQNPPETWDELVSMGKDLTTEDHHGLMIPSTGYPYWMFQALAIQNGQELMSNDGLTTYFDDPDTVEALEFWKSLSTEHSIMRSPTGGGNFYLFKDSTDAEKQAALELIKFMTAPEQAAEWSIETGYMGVSPAAYETEALQDYTADFPPALVARDQLEHAVAEFSTFETARVRDGLNAAIQSALTGDKSPEAALAEAQAAAERQLRAYK